MQQAELSLCGPSHLSLQSLPQPPGSLAIRNRYATKQAVLEEEGACTAQVRRCPAAVPPSPLICLCPVHPTPVGTMYDCVEAFSMMPRPLYDMRAQEACMLRKAACYGGLDPFGWMQSHSLQCRYPFYPVLYCCICITTISAHVYA